MRQLQLYTIGYEQRDIKEFINKLNALNIDTLIDVREIPASRKPGFSKSRLREHLERADKKYIHIRELGSPKVLRKKLYEDKDYEYFFVEYKKHLKKHIDSLKELHENVITNEVACLLCYERSYTQCHRSIVAEEIKSIDGNGLVVNHL